MTTKLTDEQQMRVRILQYLSMLYVPDPVTLSIVSSRQIAQALSLNLYDVEDNLEFFSKQKFIIVSGTPSSSPDVGLAPPTVMEARLSPETWATNGNRVSAFFAYYVANAPPVLRNQFSQRPQLPRKTCPLVAPPLPAACSTVIASDFSGVFEPNNIASFCCPVNVVPVESCLPISNVVDSKILATENLVRLNSFRTLLRSLYANGSDGTSFASWLDHGPRKQSSRKQLYCLAETDKALDGALPVRPAWNVAASAGGDPLGKAPISLMASDGTAIIFDPSAQTISVNGGASVPAHTLGTAAHSVVIVAVEARLFA